MKYSILNQFCRFTVIGGMGTSAHYAVLVLLVQLLSVEPVLSSSLGWTVGLMINYVLNYHFTFKSTINHQKSFIKYLSVAFVGLGINTIIMYVLINGIGIHYLLSQCAATGLTLIWNFIGNKWWTFKEKYHG